MKAFLQRFIGSRRAVRSLSSQPVRRRLPRGLWPAAAFRYDGYEWSRLAWETRRRRGLRNRLV